MSHCAHDSDLSPTVPDFSPNFAANLRNTFAKLRPQLSMPSLRRYSGHRARLKLRMTNSILLKRDGPLRASYGLLWRSVSNRVHPLRLEARMGIVYSTLQAIINQASCQESRALFLCPDCCESTQYRRFWTPCSTLLVGKNNIYKSVALQASSGSVMGCSRGR